MWFILILNQNPGAARSSNFGEFTNKGQKSRSSEFLENTFVTSIDPHKLKNGQKTQNLYSKLGQN